MLESTIMQHLLLTYTSTYIEVVFYRILKTLGYMKHITIEHKHIQILLNFKSMKKKDLYAHHVPPQMCFITNDILVGMSEIITSLTVTDIILFQYLYNSYNNMLSIW